MTVNLALGTATGDASVGSDSFTLVNTVVGSRFGDIITGDAASNAFVPGPFGPGIVGIDDAQDVIDGGWGFGSGGLHGVYRKFDRHLSRQHASNRRRIRLKRCDIGHDRRIENFTAGSGNDFVIGDGNANNFFGGAGNDYFEGSARNHFLDGGGDRFYRAIYTDATAGINIVMATGVVTGDASVGTDTLRSIEFVKGSSFDDVYDATGFGQAAPY